MLLIYKEHAVLVVNGFRAIINEEWMAYWVRHCKANTSVMVRVMSA